MHFLDIYCLFFWSFIQWSLVRKYATSHYPNQLWLNLVIHICLTRPQWAKGFVRKTWSLYISRLKTDFPVQSREYAHFPMIYSSPAVFLLSLSPNHSLKLLKYVQTGLRHKAGFILRARVYARMRAHTCAYPEPFILPAYSSARLYARMRAYVRRRVQPSWNFKALIFHPIKCVCEGHAQPTDIDALVIYARICAYVHTYNSQRICAAQYLPPAFPSVAHTRVYARWWSQKVWIQLNAGCNSLGTD